MRITTLIENRASKTDSRLIAEWGLSLHIACNGHGILFDMGASGAFAVNAGLLSVNIAAIDAAVLSHHHYDHGGGLRRFLELNSSAKVYLGAAPRGECCGKILGFLKKQVGLDPRLMTEYPERFVTVNQPVEILPDMFLISPILKTRPRPSANKYLFLKKDGVFSPDDFIHEIILTIRENGQLVIFSGCAHSGILNVVDTVASAFKGVPIKAVIGGFHFMGLPLFNRMEESKHEVENTARALLACPVAMTYTGHCTGGRAFGILESVMGERITDLRTGSSIEV